MGTHPITAVYAGDTNFTTSTSPVVNQVVNQASSTTSVASSLNPSNFGDSVIFTATVTAVAPASGTPSGTVSFFDGVTLIGAPCTLASGSCTVNTSSLIIGSHNITAVYSGDANFTGSTSSILVQVVNPAATTTTLNSSANPSVFNQNVIFTANVSSGAGTPGGTVDFLDGATNIGNCILAAGTCTFSTTTLAVGTHSITAVYAGNASFATSTSTAVNQVVNGATTTTLLNSSLNPSNFGQNVNFLASVSSGAGTPTGTVDFLDGATNIGSCTLVAGTCTFSTSTLTGGTHSITASYVASGNFAASTSTPVSQVVNPINSTTTLTAAPNPSVFGQSVTLTSNVSGAVGTPSGTVNFLDGATNIGSCTLAAGSCTATASSLIVGSHSLTAVYAGDSSFNTSTSTAVNQVVNKASLTVTLTTLPNPSAVGQNVTLSASLAVTAPGGGTPTGTIDFFDNGTLIGNGTISGGVATFATTSLALGTHPLTATYNGNVNFNSSTSAAVNQVVSKTVSSVSLSATPNPSLVGQNVAFTATVASPSGTPTGTVNFLDGATNIGSCTLVVGSCTFSTNSLTKGAHPISAVYGGDTTFNTSTSPTVNQQVGGTPLYTSLPVPTSTIALGDVQLNATSTGSLKVTNVGNLPLNVSAPSALAAPFSVNVTGTFTLDPTKSLTVSVTCQPTALGSYTASLTYTTDDSTKPTVSYSLTCNGVAPPQAGFVKTLTPARLYDSRVGTPLLEAPLGRDGPISTGVIRTIKATGQVGVPLEANAILANITIANAQGGGNLRAFPANLTDVNTASLNWYNSSLGLGPRVVANFVIISLDNTGSFKIASTGTTDFIIDVTGYLVNAPTGAGVFKALASGTNPRLYDSRPAGATNTALTGQGSGLVKVGQPDRIIKIGGTGSPQNIPATATAVIVNVTVADSEESGYFTLFPAGTAVPKVSSVNWQNWRNPGTNIPRDVANMAIVPLNTNGEINVVAGGTTDSGANLIVDVLGYVDTAIGANSGFYLPLSSQLRLYDSRLSEPVYLGSTEKDVLNAATTRSIKGNGVLSVPATAKSVLVRISTVDVGGGGYLAMYPAEPYPGNSSVNTNNVAQQIGNLAIVQLDSSGNFLVRNGSSLNNMGFVIDIIAYFN